MSGDEYDRVPSNQASAESAQSLPAVPAEQKEVSDWEKRKTVLQQIFQTSPSAGIIPKRRWESNLWRLDPRGLLSVLRAEVFREKARSEATEAARAVNSESGQQEQTEPGDSQNPSAG